MFTVCATSYTGACFDIFSTCPSGYVQSYSHCGLLELCCYPQHSTSTGIGTGTGTGTGSHTGTGTGSHQTSSGAQCGIPDVTSHRIVGGTVATVHAYPWQVSLRYGSHHMCGGTIIDSQWILTAAHCFEDTTHSYWTVATGIHDRGHIYRSQVHNVRNVIVHTGYSSRSNHNDIALIKLDKPLDLTDSTTKAACLPNKHEDFDGLVCTVTGWGALHTDGPGTRLLNEVDVPIMDSNRCKYYLGNVIYGSNICAGYNQGGRDACQGDSGGPLVCKKDSVYKITESSRGDMDAPRGMRQECTLEYPPSLIGSTQIKQDIHKQNR
ncbi:TMPRSS2 [Mytilus edulis]|uniref:TMPRSS2 n=1 Tax=Mytilus edulis TaxID=6550 RepID=A0A8S3RIF6_MYTED|nr:TMPRSS2 [Mytilus edulis]